MQYWSALNFQSNDWRRRQGCKAQAQHLGGVRRALSVIAAYQYWAWQFDFLQHLIRETHRPLSSLVDDLDQFDLTHEVTGVGDLGEAVSREEQEGFDIHVEGYHGISVWVEVDSVPDVC